MKTVSHFLMILLFSCIVTLVHGQTAGGKIGGRVIDAKGAAIEDISVSLINANDSGLIKVEITDKNGNFGFENLSNGEYRIWVIYMGKKEYSSERIVLSQASPVITLPPVSLQGKAIALKEVGVTASKPFVEQKIDRTVVNVDALISNVATSAFEVLEKAPGVRVDQSGAISLKGQQGVTIFIDNKPTYLSGAQLEGYLRSLPASSLDQIEIMTNPPAKYDAAGNGGIINIKTKKLKIKGFNGGINLGYGQNRYAKTSNSADFNFRYNKINLFGNLNYGTRNSFNDIHLNRKYLNSDLSTQSYFVQNTYIRRLGYSMGSSVGIDYYQSDKTTWGVVFNGALRYPGTRNENTSNLLDAGGRLDSFIVAGNREDGTFKNGGININYRRQFNKSDQELTVDLDNVVYRIESDQLLNNNNYLPDGRLKMQDQLPDSCLQK